MRWPSAENIAKLHASTEQNMAQQVEGWPLGLQPLNATIGMDRNRNNFGSMSFNTLLSGSPSSSTDSWTNFDSESTGSFFHDNSITLGSLMGVSSILELYRSSIRRTKREVLKSRKGKKSNSSSWLLCLCSRGSNLDAENNPPPSLGQFLELERRAVNEHRKNQSPLICGPSDEFALAQTITEPNTLFVNGTIAPPQSIISMQSIGTMRESKALGHGNKWFGSLARCFHACVDMLPMANS